MNKIINNKSELNILIFATVVGVLWYCTQPIAYSYDSSTYISVANFLLGKKGVDTTVFMRTVGYPLLMILTGVLPFKTFYGLLAAQFLMSLSMPLLIYKIISYTTTNQKFATYAAIFTIFSFLPYFHSKSIMTDQAFMFLLVFMSYRIVLYYQSKLIKDLWYVMISLFLLTLMRPSANPFFILCMIYSMIVLRRHYAAWLTGFVIYAGILSVFSGLFAVNSNHELKGGVANKIIGTMFYHIYLRGLDNSSYFAHQLIERIKTYNEENESIRIKYKPEFLFSGDSDSFNAKLFSEPNIKYFAYIMDTIPIVFSEKRNILLSKIIYESVKKNPSYLFSYFKTYFSGAGSSFAGQMLFYHSYVPLPLLIDKNNKNNEHFFPLSGASNKNLYNNLDKYVHAYPNSWNHLSKPENLGKYNTRTDTMLKEIFVDNPSCNTTWFMWTALDNLYSPPEVSAMFMPAAMENIKHNFSTMALMYLNNALYATFGSASDYYHGMQRISLIDPFPIINPLTYLESSTKFKRMHKEASSQPLIKFGKSVTTAFTNFECIFWTITKTLSASLILLGSVLIIKTKQFKTFALILLLWMCHIGVCSVFGEPIARYAMQIMPLNIILASITLYFILEYCRSDVKDTANDIDAVNLSYVKS